MRAALEYVLAKYPDAVGVYAEVESGGEEVVVGRELRRPYNPDPCACHCGDRPRVSMGRGPTLAAAMAAARLPYK